MRRRAILTTDSGPRSLSPAARAFRRRHGEGRRHDPPLPRHHAVVVTTDYPLAAGGSRGLPAARREESFNRISVDGDCSTNDAVVLLANGASGIARTATGDEAFAEALGDVCSSLARQIVADGEGATVVIEVYVAGASSQEEARAIARRIATSPLVKTAAFGHDPNWGRVLAAAGSAPHGDGFAALDPDRLSVSFEGSRGVRRRRPHRARAGAHRSLLPDRARPRAR
jgi:glutamate N-acetyltransferase/amino-acid N-acetyltransferase